MLRTTDVGFIFDGIVRDRVLVLRGGVGFGWRWRCVAVLQDRGEVAR